MPGPYTVDQWSFLDHKADMVSHTRQVRLTGQYVPISERRRLAAYRILQTYMTGSARTTMTAVNNDHREWGDPRLIVERIVALVLSDRMAPRIAGADRPPADRPTIPPRPVDPGADDPVEQRIYSRQLARWETAAVEAVEKWETDLDAWPRLGALQSDLDDWWEDEAVASKIYETEARNTVPQGDGALVVGWSQEKQRVTVTVYQPDAYFPVIEDGRDFPSKVHFVWEYTDHVDGQDRELLRKVTYELGPIPAQMTTNLFGRTVAAVDSRGAPIPLNPATERALFVDGEWRIVRRQPWHTDDSEATGQTCFVSDRTWVRDSGGEFGNLDDKTAWKVDADKVDLGFDFLPVIHIPNSNDSAHHYGISSLAPVVQLFDDIAGNATDLVKAAALAAAPPIGVSGSNLPTTINVAPGRAWKLGENGRLQTVDTTSAVTALMSFDEHLLDRLAVNTQLSNAVLGRVTRDLSGIALKLLISPSEQMAAVMRLTRAPKHALLLKMWQRISQVHGALDPGPTVRAHVEYGPIIPTDTDAVVEQVTGLLQADAISTETGLTLLVAAGFPIDDAQAEVGRIRAGDTQGAKDIADATGSEQVAADWLGVDLPDVVNPGPPQVSLP